jgi:hypothetical protein
MLQSGRSWAQSTSNLIYSMGISIAAITHPTVAVILAIRTIMKRVSQNTSHNLPGSQL